MYLNHFQASKIIKQVAKYKKNCFTFVIPTRFTVFDTAWIEEANYFRYYCILGFQALIYLIDFHMYVKIKIILKYWMQPL